LEIVEDEHEGKDKGGMMVRGLMVDELAFTLEQRTSEINNQTIKPSNNNE
jgi:hypothetical protein